VSTHSPSEEEELNLLSSLPSLVRLLFVHQSGLKETEIQINIGFHQNHQLFFSFPCIGDCPPDAGWCLFEQLEFVFSVLQYCSVLLLPFGVVGGGVSSCFSGYCHLLSIHAPLLISLE
jgi:hypothetical protein